MTSTPSTIDARFTGQLGEFTLDAGFMVPGNGITGIFGPSGCGKTSILRSVAGLQHLPGRLCVAGDVWQDDGLGIFRKTHERPLGYVFQEASLFPHLNVLDNLLYGWKRVKSDMRHDHIKLDDVVDLLNIKHLLRRSPEALSGGERQRVGIGRALMSQPRLLLLDEPLSALDPMTREDILPYFDSLHAVLKIPCLYVSHDIRELERLADTLLLIDRGRVLACGPLAELQADPSLPLMRMPRAGVTLEGTVVSVDDSYGLIHVALEGAELVVPAKTASQGDIRRVYIEASDVSFNLTEPEATTILNCLPVKILSITASDQDPNQITVLAGLGKQGEGARIIGRITRKSRENLGLNEGSQVYAQIKSASFIR